MDDLINIPDAPLLSGQGQSWLDAIIPDFNFAAAVKSFASGENAFSAQSVVGRLGDLFLGEITKNARTMGVLLGIAIFCVLLCNLQSSFGKKGVGEAAFFASYSLLAGVGLASFSQALGYARSAADNLVLLMEGLVPPLAALMISGGAPVSASAMQGVIFYMCHLMALVIKSAIVPLAIFSAALSFLNSLSGSVNFSAFAKLFAKLYKYLLGALMTVFTAVITVTGFAASSFDGAGAKTLKFTVSALVPVVGSSLSDAMDSVVGSAKLMRSAFGAAGIVALCSVCAAALIKLGALIVIYRVSAAAASPLGEKRLEESIGAMADCMGQLFAAVAALSAMTVISLAALMGA